MVLLFCHFTANSSHYFYIILKLITLFGVVTLLYTSEVFFENIFLIRPWKALFVTTDDSIQEWWFRFKIDRYVSLISLLLLSLTPSNNRIVFLITQSVLFGMVFAFSYCTLKKYNLIHDSEYKYLFTPGISILSVLLSIIGLTVSIPSSASGCCVQISNVCFALFLLFSLSTFISLQFYIGFSFLCRDKADCNEIHPYISFVPV